MKRKKGEGSVFQRGAVYWVKYYRNGKAYRESSGSTKEADARKLLRERHGEMALGRFTGPDADKVTIRELAVDYVTDYRVNGKKSLSKALRMVTRHDDEGKEKDSILMEYFGDFKAHEVGTDLIKRYVAKRQEQGAANASINRELSAIKRMFNLGIQAEKIFRKPYVPMLQEHNVRQGFFERAEFIAFRAALPEYLKPVVTFAYSTGWRRQEILSLKWNQVDLASKSVRIEGESTKNKKARTIALDGELLEAIQGQWEKRVVAAIPGESPTLLCQYVFHRNGKPLGDFRDAWDNALKATGLAGKILHDFRRTAVRNMTRAGVPERVAMMVSGHKTRSVFDRYDIVSDDDLREAARKSWEHAQNQEEAAKVVALRSNQ
jgi:integrase